MKILQAIVAMEDVANGQIFEEHERTFYVRISDFDQLKRAASADHQEQWTQKFAKTEKNAAKGNIRVRMIYPLFKNGEPVGYSRSEGSGVQYVLTAKAERSATHRQEVPVPATKDMFEIFKALADSGMVKDRYHFPVAGTDLVFEVDMFRRGETYADGYHEWAKIDLEFDKNKHAGMAIPELPIQVDQVIMDNTTVPLEKAMISDIYDRCFLTKNPLATPKAD